MARPIKLGLDYFPLDVNCDEKLLLIEAQYGVIGFGIVIKLWQKIYKNGYYMEWNESQLLLLKKQSEISVELINEILSSCFKWKIFNDDMYEKNGILTSESIQKTYLLIVQKRGKNTIEKGIIWLIPN